MRPIPASGIQLYHMLPGVEHKTTWLQLQKPLWSTLEMRSRALKLSLVHRVDAVKQLINKLSLRRSSVTKISLAFFNQSDQIALTSCPLTPILSWWKRKNLARSCIGWRKTLIQVRDKPLLRSITWNILQRYLTNAYLKQVWPSYKHRSSPQSKGF